MMTHWDSSSTGGVQTRGHAICNDERKVLRHGFSSSHAQHQRWMKACYNPKRAAGGKLDIGSQREFKIPGTVGAKTHGNWFKSFEEVVSIQRRSRLDFATLYYRRNWNRDFSLHLSYRIQKYQNVCWKYLATQCQLKADWWTSGR